MTTQLQADGVSEYRSHWANMAAVRRGMDPFLKKRAAPEEQLFYTGFNRFIRSQIAWQPIACNS
jgi:hypothetical protein